MAIPAPKLLIGKVVNFQLWADGIILLFIVIICFILLGQTPQLQEDTTVPIQSKLLAIRIVASGTVVPHQTVNLSPKTAGRIATLYVEQGDKS